MTSQLSLIHVLIYVHAVLFTFLFSAYLLHHPNSAVKSSTTTTTTTDEMIEFIRTSCNKIAPLTPRQDLCFSSLSGYATTVNKNPNELAKLAISLAIAKTNDTANYFSRMLPTPEKLKTSDKAGHRLDDPLLKCFITLGNAAITMKKSLEKMRQIENATTTDTTTTNSSCQMAPPSTPVGHVGMFLSAALISESLCTDGFEQVQYDDQMKRDLVDHVREVKGLTHIAFGLAYNLYVSPDV